MYAAIWLLTRIGMAAVLTFTWVATILCWAGFALGMAYEER